MCRLNTTLYVLTLVLIHQANFCIVWLLKCMFLSHFAEGICLTVKVELQPVEFLAPKSTEHQMGTDLNLKVIAPLLWNGQNHKSVCWGVGWGIYTFFCSFPTFNRYHLGCGTVHLMCDKTLCLDEAWKMNTQPLGISYAVSMFSDLITELVSTSLQLSLISLD